VTYRVTTSKHAARNLRALDPQVRRRVQAAIRQLATDSRPHGVMPVIGIPGTLRVRVGGYRVVYSLDDERREVWVEAVRHRREVYRNL